MEHLEKKVWSKCVLFFSWGGGGGSLQRVWNERLNQLICLYLHLHTGHISTSNGQVYDNVRGVVKILRVFHFLWLSIPPILLY